MKKLLVIIAVVIVVLVIALASSWLWLTRTESGAGWALHRAAGQVERLEWGELEGGLAGGLILTDVDFEQAGMRTTVERLELAAIVHLSLRPSATVKWLRMEGVAVHLPETEREPPEDRGPFDPAILASPIEVDIRELIIERLAIHGRDETLTEIDSIALAGRWGDDLALERLEIKAEAGRLDARGQWALSEPFDGRLETTLVTGLAEDGTEQEITLGLEGKLDDLTITLAARGPLNLKGQGQLREALTRPGGRIGLTGALADWPGLDLRLSDLSLAVEGRPDEWSATITSRVEGYELPPGRIVLEAHGDLEGATIDSLAAEVLDGTVAGRGELGWVGPLSASADVRFEKIDLTPLYPDWPNQARLDGELAGRLEGNDVWLERFDLSAPPTALRVTGTGHINHADDEVALDLAWENFTWPPITDDSEPLVASESGRVHLDGAISDWRMELEALVEGAEWPQAEVSLDASGSDSEARIARFHASFAPSGRISASGSIAWQPYPQLDLAIELNELDPGHFVSRLPGRVNAEIGLTATRDPTWLANIDLARLEGELRGQPLSGQGRASLSDEAAETAELAVTLGDNDLRIESGDGERWRWQIDAGRMDQLWPDIAGSARLSGHVEPAAGRLAVEGRIESGTFGGYNLGKADLDANLIWLERPEADIRIKLEDLDVNPWERIEHLEFTLAGDCASHQLALVTAGRRASLDLATQGTLHDCLEPSRHWQGRLERLFIGETVAGSWRLEEALPFEVSERGTRAGQGCLSAAGEVEGRLCLTELAVNDNGGHVRASIDRVPMDLILLPLDPVVSLTTPLSGQIEAGWSPEGLDALNGHLELAAGALRPLGGDRDLLAIETVRLDFTPEGRGVVIDLIARLEGDSELTGRSHVLDLRDLEGSRVEGQARLDLPDIGAFGHLAPELDQVGGRLTSNLQIHGALLAPELDGELAVDEGFFTHAPMGLEVKDIRLRLDGTARRATLAGSARSGDGQLDLEGELIAAEDGWHLDTQLEGESFQFANADWMQIVASPSIAFESTPERVNIDGDIHIDRLRGGMPPGSGERVRVSDDVEVLGESEAEEDESPTRGRPIHGRLGIELGNDARVSAIGVRTRLAGALELLFDGRPDPRGRGTIRLPEGSYRAYGQNLEITEGQIIFTGHPIDDPRLDIRAVRDIFGDPAVQVAGAHIHGSAREPEIDLFTRPPTSEEKALAYIVTGADFDHAGGQGAINVGFYLLPRLFVSYGLGLFETGNVLSGRYELSERWGLRVVSGERDTGADISYTVNN